MKARTDSVPAWPFALVCAGLFVAVTWRQPNFITPIVQPASPAVVGGLAPAQPSQKLAADLAAHTQWSESVWGEPVEQLQLAMSMDSTTGKLIAWLRNTSSNEVFIHNYGVGDLEWAAPEILIGVRWVRLNLRRDRLWGLLSAGPINQDIMKLAPRENLSWERISGRRGASKWLLEPDLTARFTNSLKLSRDAVEQPTFMAWLRNYDWPESIAATDRVTMRLVQGVSIPAGVTPCSAEEVAQWDRLLGSIVGAYSPGLSLRYKATGGHLIRLSSAPVNIEAGHRQIVALRAWLFEPLSHRILAPQLGKSSP